MYHSLWIIGVDRIFRFCNYFFLWRMFRFWLFPRWKVLHHQTKWFLRMDLKILFKIKLQSLNSLYFILVSRKTLNTYVNMNLSLLILNKNFEKRFKILIIRLLNEVFSLSRNIVAKLVINNKCCFYRVICE